MHPEINAALNAPRKVKILVFLESNIGVCSRTLPTTFFHALGRFYRVELSISTVGTPCDPRARGGGDFASPD